MKTVLFIDKDEGELWSSFERLGYLLEEWLWNDDMVVCNWNREGMSVEAAIPDLEDLLDGEDEWEALVVTDLRVKPGMPHAYEDSNFANPFDFPENYHADFTEPLLESCQPVVRITQMLGGIPDRVSLSTDQDDGFKIVHPRAEDYYDRMERYRLGLPRPQRIVCVTPRNVDDDLSRELVNRGHMTSADAERFWERNGFATTTRFLTFDIPQGMHADDASKKEGQGWLRQDRVWLDFWTSIITLSMNRFVSSDLQAFRLYNMGVKIDGSELQSVIAKKLGVWQAAYDVVGERIGLELDMMESSVLKETGIPDCSTSIDVEFTDNELEVPKVDEREVGMFKDMPKNDVDAWESSFGQVLETFKDFLWAPRRSVRKAAIRYRSCCELDQEDLEYCILNGHSIERLEDELLNGELEIVQSVGKTPFDYDSYGKSIKQKHDAVIDQIGNRSIRNATISTVVLCVATMFIGLLPLSFGKTTDPRTNIVAFAIAVVCSVLMAAVGVVAIFRQRFRIVSGYREFNQMIAGLYDQMRFEALDLSRRVSLYATLKKKWLVLDRQGHRNIPTRKLTWLRSRQALLKERMKGLERLIGDGQPFDKAAYRYTMQRGWKELASSLDTDSFFSFRAFDPVQRPLNASILHGGMVTVPFPFVSQVWVVPVQLRIGVSHEQGEAKC